MIKRVVYFLLLVFLVVAGIVLFNTFRFSKVLPVQESLVISGGSDSVAQHLSEAIQIKTISFGDTLAIDTTEFTKFRVFMEASFPVIHQKLTRQIFNQFSYVFTWKGKDSTLSPYVLMAHMDVVPVEAVAESKWTVPSFSGLIKNDTIWGRGAVDDKASVVAIMETVEQLLKENYTPERTIYLCFGHDEEIAGRRGAGTFSKWFKENNIKPALVLDEGGQIDLQHFKDLNRPVAVIATGEKGYVNIDLTVEIPGGHSSMPLKETAIDVLNKAIVKIRAQQMPAIITPPVQELLQRTGPGGKFKNRMALSNLWLFKRMVIGQMEQSKEMNASIHTTLVPTIVKAGIKDNVIPSVAKATFNSRILPGQTSDDVVNFVKNAINDNRVDVKKQTISLMEPSSTTASDHPAFKKIESITYKTVPNVLVSPYLLLGATDSRYFRSFSDAVLNFIPMQDPKGFHGIDERIGISDLKRMMFFYKLLITEKQQQIK
ncbi:MAG: M20/M25/M40 family metallo-hydrolase [Ferruginibacter sp.]